MNPDDHEENNWLNGWEQQCVESIEEQPDYEQSLNAESDHSSTKIWNGFQESATHIAQLYRDRYAGDPGALWLQFQMAASSVTSLYKESCESLKRSSEIAKQLGYQKRNAELLNWVKRKRRLIRREDLLAYLSGKPPPPRQNHFHHHSHHRLSPRPRNISPPPGVQPPASLGLDTDLHTFREALFRAPLSKRTTSDLCTFIAGEMARHCKRPASPSDVTMDSPTQQKKPRFM
ncbi:UPF0472 protein C16orf72 [Coccinella septempunctata]|uniref:UPF0472 protein C16orf72 n=1 Tax=Coccinella septempunctata TaxID=41139 RepID=UPI001D06B373|nr:UPF0472 protein C16orf72 [Coccinella septempunctata]